MNDVTEVIAQNVKKRRRELGLTQQSLADLMGYSAKAVSKWESGGGAPPTVILPTLAACLKTTVDRLLCECEEQEYFLGIDGGGTKTEFVLADSDGNTVRRTVLGTSNPSDIGISASLDILRAGISETCGAIPLHNISVFAGIAGSSTGDMTKKINGFLSRMGFKRVSNGSDTLNIVSASLGKRDGIAVIMGTGSAVMAQCNGETYRTGGYGYLFSDAGGGFSYGRQAILAALYCEDGSGDATSLYALVKKQCGTRTVRDAIGVFYEGGKKVVAEYAPLVFKACSDGDELAKKILYGDLCEIAKCIRGAAKRLPLGTKSVEVKLCGGLCAFGGQIIPVLSSILAELEGERVVYRISITERTPIYGALLLAGMPDINCKINEKENDNEKNT